MNNTTLINKNDIKKAWFIAKVNFKNTKLAYILAIGLFLATAISSIIVTGIIGVEENGNVMSNLLLLAIILVPILIPARNFRKIMALNAKKKHFFLGTLINYLILSFIVTLSILILYYGVENYFNNKIAAEFPTFLTVFDAFGWSNNGPFIGFLQFFGFLFFVCVFIHLLTSLQDNWLGWALDILIIVLISVFIPIAVLRTNFWGNLIILTITGHPALQISFTVIGGLLVYSLYLLVLRTKKI